MQIRLLRVEELDVLLALYAHLHGTDAVEPNESVAQQVWREIHSNPRNLYFGAFVGGELVSSCVLTVVPNLTRGCKPYGLIENVVAHEQHRRRGHGKAMVAHALAQAWAAGCYKVMLLTGRKDEAIFRFYESVGFDRHGKQGFVATRAE